MVSVLAAVAAEYVALAAAARLVDDGTLTRRALSVQHVVHTGYAHGLAAYRVFVVLFGFGHPLRRTRLAYRGACIARPWVVRQATPHACVNPALRVDRLALLMGPAALAARPAFLSRLYAALSFDVSTGAALIHLDRVHHHALNPVLRARRLHRRIGGLAEGAVLSYGLLHLVAASRLKVRNLRPVGVIFSNVRLGHDVRIRNSGAAQLHKLAVVRLQGPVDYRRY